LMRQKGRRSISLEDTASSSYLRRQRSRNWSGLNRRQDYYFEGALLWYEIDTILREKTESKISLDDFIRRFLGRYDRAKPLICYTEQDVIDTLNEFVPYDWKTLIEDRVRGLHSELPLDVLDRLGYRIAYSSQPTDYDKDPSRTALGMTVSTNGTISTIDPDGPADRAGLREDAKIVGIDHRKFSFNALKDAIADSIAKRMIELLLLEGDEFVKVEIEYDDGPKYMDIVRNDKPDVLSDIFTPQVHD